MHYEVLNRFNKIMPLLHPVNDMKINDSAVQENVIKLEALEKRILYHPSRDNRNFEELYENYKKKLELEANLEVAKAELKKAQSLLQLEELNCRKHVLRRLQYCDGNDVIQPKVRI
ncbi:unnamed protein product [Gongylonema pulchrum]|uniref:rRNA_proc-arch domain-containing protein n=1 Tax=Gongylonema pulchrum TaxID=637853 RepID=A0A183EPB6_9BILA|nr:unnamed protein product [Gongylonema pulchrum]